MRTMLPLTVLATFALPGHPGAQSTATDLSQAGYTRISCTADSETHFDTVAVALASIQGPPPAPPLHLGTPLPATRMTFAAFEPNWGAQDRRDGSFHPAPAAQFVIVLSGVMEITTSDGQTRQFAAGGVLRVEDVAPCRGHLTAMGDAPVRVVLLR